MKYFAIFAKNAGSTRIYIMSNKFFLFTLQASYQPLCLIIWVTPVILPDIRCI